MKTVALFFPEPLRHCAFAGGHDLRRSQADLDLVIAIAIGKQLSNYKINLPQRRQGAKPENKEAIDMTSIVESGHEALALNHKRPRQTIRDKSKQQLKNDTTK